MKIVQKLHFQNLHTGYSAATPVKHDWGSFDPSMSGTENMLVKCKSTSGHSIPTIYNVKPALEINHIVEKGEEAMGNYGKKYYSKWLLSLFFKDFNGQ